MKDKIVIKGAKVHNLKNVDLTVPRNEFVVFTGLSGSGKSSLAFDTLYAEGQRRYMESLSSYARQFLGQMDKPNVEYIEGLSPAISIDQKTTGRNPRSTVGTVTEIYDYLRLLYAKIGVPHCPNCGKEISQQTVDQIVDSVMKLEERTKIQVLAPVVRGRKGEHTKLIAHIKKSGFVRVRIDGEVYEIDEDEIKLDKNKKHHIEALVDRIVIKQGVEGRLTDSVETALKLAEGLVVINVMGKEDMLFSENFACPDCGISIGEISPSMFSFNAPFGKCDVCDGIGTLLEIDEDLVIPDKSKSIMEGAIAPWGEGRLKEESWTFGVLKALSKKYKLDINKPIEDYDEKTLNILLYGAPDVLKVNYVKDSQEMVFNHHYEGIINQMKRRYMESNSDYIKSEIENYMSNNPCPKCKGARLKKEVLAITVGNKNIFEFCSMPIREEVSFIDTLELSNKHKIISAQIVKEIKSRLEFLINVGLDYLNLAREARTLSGGESQRIRLATQIGSSLVGVLYILDEPSIGLHQRDNDRLIATMKNLKDIGNTLIVVEHDEDTIKAADFIVDIGPGAGEHGGEIIAAGSLEDIKNCKESITGQYLTGVKKIEVPKERREAGKNFIEIVGAKENNLKNVNVKFPVGLFTCVTGVSGSGKSTLVNEILYKALNKKINRSKLNPGKYKSINGIENIDKIIDINQSPIGRTPRSNPATYTGVFDIIRELYASTKEAKLRGYKAGRFSFNVKGGRCEACKGDGIVRIEMQFLSDVYVPCDVCKGKRYNRETLEIKYKDKNIDDLLNMTVEDALKFFENLPRIKNKLQTLADVGLGYVRLGQPSTQLSGGEAQRIKLAYELSKRSTGKTLYILDEPTTGLHTDDVKKLISILQRLTDMGNTVVVIEHNLDVIKCADYIVDLGPEGGEKGGTILCSGTPEQVAQNSSSYTGQYLKKML
ncbi:excinuclease ABC subunit A [Clostridium acetobutylicum]|uniref:UvrABC system protein A n=1 Tax=Clostridium acetobutylicum (strain ATCC 824 / DSM 792 / JCM 1419 / IAM 19013 / LMG 5710 / NBRC 13948 / NRRL B-527 / VKM B-1787 / 2291 / W) TaxID=272562 RepID=UVRA_CLOAB|nr:MULTISPECIES: excinuclease ABC subunit UvrA [Clostridium]Q97LQ1.1 RecName: Full=UvrABC system protein A; Short=UvrA protein; AltName: Full=Excinuclease ABC subunit A [Clostridium acetobutylicum ATCC 824]AAK78483.1 Excinuclease ABC subunit A (ATP-ase), (uvrA) [Clostridium acetobutylicum ATCC 824]ADZ19553.1 Excinuclease ABC subunit A (ATP-ase), (uvrA) [Clostridium acetobutylicum EA 2018]AEI33627.1 excinuclease ABC subunit A [Clostridium acetobutylicum DSM 1731]AWV80204.1 excinuclease ABC subu